MSNFFKTTTTKLLTSTIFTTALVSAGPAFAQDGDQAQSRYAIDEIVVTARRVEESLQDAAIAVTALSGLDLENRGSVDVIDFADAAPNVNFKAGGTTSGFGAAPVVTIRGVGQSDFVINTDPAVGVYADGVYLGRSIGSVLDLVDVDRVEALRGPQGTLFGRNSIGGAINIISKKPDPDAGFEGYASAAAGEEGYLLFRGSANVPLGEDLALRVSGMHRERDGFIDSLVYDDLEFGAENVSAVRAALRWQPNEQFTVDVDADYTARTDSAAPVIATVLGDLGANETDLDISGAGPEQRGISTSVFARRFNREAFAPPVAPGVAPFASDPAANCSDPTIRDTSPDCLGAFYTSSVEGGSFQSFFDANGDLIRPDNQELDAYGFSGRLTYEHDLFTLKSITSARGFDSSFINGSPAPIYTGSNINEQFDTDQFSQEVTLEGNFLEDRLGWIIGGFYFTEDGVERVRTVFPLQPPADGINPDFLPSAGIENRLIDNESLGAFGQLSFDITDAITLTGGARVTNETKDVEVNTFTDTIANGPSIGTVADSLEVTEPSFLVNLSWEATDDTLLYAQFSDGFRSGGFPARTPPGSTVPFDQLVYDPEFVDSYELGAKTSLFDGAIRANLAAFRSEYTDQQINATAIDPVNLTPLGTVANLADSTIQGIELEANWLVTDDFRIDASIGYLDATLGDINTDALVDPDTNEVITPANQFILNSGTNLDRVITEDDDIDLPNAPTWQINVGANYSFFLADGSELRNRLDVVHESSQFSTIANYDFGRVPSTTRLNYFLTYIPENNFEFQLGVRNLTDEIDFVNSTYNAAPGAGGYRVFRRGREAFAQLKYNFGG